MKEDVLVPSVGESVTRGVLTSWIKKEEERVEEGEDLFELETDKATVAVPAPADGVLHILVQAGQEVEIGQVVASLEETVQTGAPPEAEEKSGLRERPERKEKPEQPAAGRNLEAGNGSSAAADVGKPVERPAAEPALSPTVRRIVQEYGLDVRELEGTGPRGRITKEDALRAVAESAPRRTASTEVEAGRRAPQAQASPAVQRQTREPMSRLRRTIAGRLVQARQQTALLTTFNEIDMEKVISLRNRYGERFAESYGVRLGFMSFFVSACCQALKTFPVVNAMIEGDEIVYNHVYDIGVAVSTDRGLVVPVLRDADRLTFAEIERRLLDLARRARDNKIAPDELAGGTFTITNGGVFGSLLSTPLPNYPQSAILGMHAIQKRPVAVDDQVAIRSMMYVALSYDHRLIDGREAVRFLVTVKSLVEDPQRLLLEV
jgi:2-oxoglutarate dehydrogenase E2 component (dihydrolipoamide succinyltransferase)